MVEDKPTNKESFLTAKQVQKIFDRKILKGLPKHKKEGTRRQWIRGFELIRNWNWSFYQGQIVSRDERTCQDCGIKDSMDGYEVHHIIPRVAGGSNHPHNLKSLCPSCHRKYTNHLLRNRSAYHPKQRSLS